MKIVLFDDDKKTCRVRSKLLGRRLVPLTDAVAPKLETALVIHTRDFFIVEVQVQRKGMSILYIYQIFLQYLILYWYV